MHLFSKTLRLAITCCFIALLAPVACAQWYGGPTLNDQRNALNALRTQINLLQNATRTAPAYGDQGYGNLLGQFQNVRGAYDALKQTLNPRQLTNGGNALAELDAGLDIIQEAFGNYENDLAGGRNPGSALRDLGQILRQSMQVWSQQFHRTASSLRIGIG